MGRRRRPALRAPHGPIRRDSRRSSIRGIPGETRDRGGEPPLQAQAPVIAHALAHHRIGFEEVADGEWSIYFGTVLLGRLDERTYTIYG